MVTMLYNKDANPDLIKSKKVAVLGFGSQGHAHSLNMKEQGVDVVVGLREGSSSRAKAESAGLTVMTVAEATKWADLVMLALPDTKQPKIYRDEIEPNLEEGMMLMFAHGFNVHYGAIVPPANVDVALAAPKSPGHLVRHTFTEGGGTPGLIAVYQDFTGQARELSLSYAWGVGCTRAGVIETTFKDETETDLFGEQAVLCGGTAELVKAGFETLVEAGYSPEMAYFECMHELKLIVDLMYRGGLNFMRYSVSDTAEVGDYWSGPRVITADTKKIMGDILTDIQDGTFAKRWIAENEAGRDSFNETRKRDEEHPIEVVGKELRAMMPFVDPVVVTPSSRNN